MRVTLSQREWLRLLGRCFCDHRLYSILTCPCCGPLDGESWVREKETTWGSAGEWTRLYQNDWVES